MRPTRVDRSAFDLGVDPARVGSGSISSASTIKLSSLPRTNAGGCMLPMASNPSSSDTPRRARDSARDPLVMSSKTISNGRVPTSRLTAVRALNPARSSASRIADRGEFRRVADVFVEGHLQPLVCHPIGSGVESLSGLGFDGRGVTAGRHLGDKLGIDPLDST